MKTASNQVILWLSAFACITLASGCANEGGPSGQPVAGKVSLDGKPIENGKIVLSHVDGRSAAAGEIKNGEFHLRSSDGAIPGKYRVSIHSEKKTGKTIPHPDITGSKIEEVVEAVPVEYNVNTKLEAEIKADGENALEFALKSPVRTKSATRRR